MNTDTDMNDNLQDLVAANMDSARQLEEASEIVNDESLAVLFADFAQSRRINAVELREFLSMNEKEEAREGTITGTLREKWLLLRGKLQDGDEKAVLEEAERCEDVIKAAYEDIISDEATSEVSNLLKEQYLKVKSGHDRIRDLRDEYKSMH